MSIADLIRKRPYHAPASDKSAIAASAARSDSSQLAKIAALVSPAAVPPQHVEPTQRSHWWKIKTANRTHVVLISGYPAAADVQGYYPNARIEPISGPQTEAAGRSRIASEVELIDWLEKIGEYDASITAEIVDMYRKTNK